MPTPFSLPSRSRAIRSATDSAGPIWPTFARFAPIFWRAGERVLALRPPGAGLLVERPIPVPMVALVMVMLATVTFDGVLVTPAWTAYYEFWKLMPSLQPLWQDILRATTDVFSRVAKERRRLRRLLPGVGGAGRRRRHGRGGAAVRIHLPADRHRLSLRTLPDLFAADRAVFHPYHLLFFPPYNLSTFSLPSFVRSNSLRTRS